MHKLLSLHAILIISSLSPQPTLAMDTIRAGFYEAKPRDTFLGSLIHLRTQDMLDKRSPGRVLKGLRGSFALHGSIFTRFLADGTPGYFWKNSAFGYTDGLRVLPQADGSLLLEAPKQNIRLRLSYLGPRPPGEGRAQPKTRYLAHRGFSYFPPYNAQSIYPANSLPALRAALQEGYGGFELDVRLSREGKFVVSHDQNLKIATSCAGKVSEKSVAELKGCLINGSTLVPELIAIRSPTTVRMSTLREVLEQFHGDSRLESMVIDVKPGSEDRLVDAFRDAIEPFWNRPDYLEKILVVAQSESVIRRLRQLCPWPEYYLEGSLGIEPLDKGEAFFPEAYGVPRQAHQGISLNAGLGMYLPPATGIHRVAGTVSFAHAFLYPVLGWTVNVAFELAGLRKFAPGMDLLLTDAPQGVVASLQLRDYYQQEPSLEAAVAHAEGYSSEEDGSFLLGLTQRPLEVPAIEGHGKDAP